MLPNRAWIGRIIIAATRTTRSMSARADGLGALVGSFAKDNHLAAHESRMGQG